MSTNRMLYLKMLHDDAELNRDHAKPSATISTARRRISLESVAEY